MEMFEGWAPPGRVWGPWVEIGELFGTYTYKVDFKTISNAPSTFDAELLYWGAGRKISEIVSGPGTHNLLLEIVYVFNVFDFAVILSAR